MRKKYILLLIIVLVLSGFNKIGSEEYICKKIDDKIIPEKYINGYFKKITPEIKKKANNWGEPLFISKDKKQVILLEPHAGQYDYIIFLYVENITEEYLKTHEFLGFSEMLMDINKRP